MGLRDWLSGSRKGDSDAEHEPSEAPLVAPEGPVPGEREAWRPHPVMSSAYPPYEGATFAGLVMSWVVIGTEDSSDLEERISDLIDSGEFAWEFPDEPELSEDEAREVLEAVIAEHNRLVPHSARDTINLRRAFSRLEADGIAVSFGVGWDTGEGAEDGYEQAQAMATRRGNAVLGYVYSHTQDIDRLVATGTLLIGFSDMSGDMGSGAARLAERVVDTVRGYDLPVHWSGDPTACIEVGPIRYEQPFPEA
ncbi:DUF6891 domain-containing protein [Demetria terragena]|uniref:DUF6891 domain-containing protein n=1 Tax=Demetria terragena TaxID=63959 RepID=UPI000371458E|nr:hypothetical protein [Demetria terragena]